MSVNHSLIKWSSQRLHRHGNVKFAAQHGLGSGVVFEEVFVDTVQNVVGRWSRGWSSVAILQVLQCPCFWSCQADVFLSQRACGGQAHHSAIHPSVRCNMERHLSASHKGTFLLCMTVEHCVSACLLEILHTSDAFKVTSCHLGFSAVCRICAQKV